MFKVLALVLLPTFCPGQAPPGTTGLSDSQATNVNSAADAADAVSAGMAGTSKEQVKAAIENARKMIKAGRVLNADPVTGPKGSGAGTTQEAIKDGKYVRTSGVGVGTEYILLGAKLVSGSFVPTYVGGTLVHEGIRTKQSGEEVVPPGGGVTPDWELPLDQRRNKLLNDCSVYMLDVAYWEAVAAAAAGDPTIVRWANDFARKRAEKAAEAFMLFGWTLL